MDKVLCQFCQRVKVGKVVLSLAYDGKAPGWAEKIGTCTGTSIPGNCDAWDPGHVTWCSGR